MSALGHFVFLVREVRRLQKLYHSKAKSEMTPGRKGEVLMLVRAAEGNVDKFMSKGWFGKGEEELAKSVLRMRELQTEFWQRRYTMTPDQKKRLLMLCKDAEREVDSALQFGDEPPVQEGLF